MHPSTIKSITQIAHLCSADEGVGGGGGELPVSVSCVPRAVPGQLRHLHTFDITRGRGAWQLEVAGAYFDTDITGVGDLTVITKTKPPLFTVVTRPTYGHVTAAVPPVTITVLAHVPHLLTLGRVAFAVVLR